MGEGRNHWVCEGGGEGEVVGSAGVAEEVGTVRQSRAELVEVRNSWEGVLVGAVAS